MLHFLHWCYTWTALLSANQNRVIFFMYIINLRSHPHTHLSNFNITNFAQIQTHDFLPCSHDHVPHQLNKLTKQLITMFNFLYRTPGYTLWVTLIFVLNSEKLQTLSCYSHFSVLQYRCFYPRPHPNIHFAT